MKRIAADRHRRRARRRSPRARDHVSALADLPGVPAHDRRVRETLPPLSSLKESAS